MLYEREIWAETLEVKKRASSLVSIQKTAALRIASAYRTVSAIAVLVKAGAIPMDLLATERMEIYKANSAGSHITGRFRENTITKWQRRCNDEVEEGGQAVRDIAEVRPWIGRKFGEVKYYIAQLQNRTFCFRVCPLAEQLL